MTKGAKKGGGKGVEVKTMDLAGPEAFKLKAKKPEPDDRPRPMGPSGKSITHAKRGERLKNVRI